MEWNYASLSRVTDILRSHGESSWSSISEGIGADNASVGCEWSCHPDPEGTPSFGWQPMRNRKRGCVIIKNPFPGSMQVSGGRILHSPYLEILESEALKIIALGGSS